jgi:hypothetical protein
MSDLVVVIGKDSYYLTVEGITVDAERGRKQRHAPR